MSFGLGLGVALGGGVRSRNEVSCGPGHTGLGGRSITGCRVGSSAADVTQYCQVFGEDDGNDDGFGWNAAIIGAYSPRANISRSGSTAVGSSRSPTPPIPAAASPSTPRQWRVPTSTICWSRIVPLEAKWSRDHSRSCRGLRSDRGLVLAASPQDASFLDLTPLFGRSTLPCPTLDGSHRRSARRQHESECRRMLRHRLMW